MNISNSRKRKETDTKEVCLLHREVSHALQDPNTKRERLNDPIKLVISTQKELERGKCEICHGLLRTPHQTTCGHLYCKVFRHELDQLHSCVCVCVSQACLDTWLAQNHTCPICRTHLSPSDHYEDKRMAREIGELKVKCCYSEDGCSWSGELGVENAGLKKHMDECDFHTVKCRFPHCPVSCCNIAAFPHSGLYCRRR